MSLFLANAHSDTVNGLNGAHSRNVDVVSVASTKRQRGILVDGVVAGFELRSTTALLRLQAAEH